jgi:hypothetical protein
MYKLYNDPLTGKPLNVVNRTNQNGTVTSIPFDPDNMDFVEYQKFLEDGGTPLPAENT